MRRLLSLLLVVPVVLSLGFLGPASAALADPEEREADDFEARACEVTVGGFEFEVDADGGEVEIAPGVDVELDELGLFGLRQLRILRAARLAVALCELRGFDFEVEDFEDRED